MRHLKQFENQTFSDSIGYCWVVKTYWYEDREASVITFTNEESAEKCFLEMVNEEKMEHFENQEKKFTQNDYITDVDEAADWLSSNVNYTIDYEKSELRTYNNSVNLKMAIDVKKYNL